MRQAILAVAAVLALVGVMGCRSHTRPGAGIDPKTQAERFFAAGKAMDWKTLYEISEDASKLGSADEYAGKMKKAMSEQFLGLIYYGAFTQPEFKVGDATIS